MPMRKSWHQTSSETASTCWGLRRLALFAVVLLSLMACGISTLPAGNGTSNGCEHISCPPPARSDQQAHTFSGQGFSFQYYSPWQVSSQDPSDAVVSAATNYGDLSAEFASTKVSAGTTPQALLNSVVQNLNTNQISGLTQQGPIYGAAIGYVAGAGAAFTGTANFPNAPSVPVFLQVMTSTRGTTGLIFLATSSLDPSGPNPTDPRQVPNGEYDRMVNSVVWT